MIQFDNAVDHFGRIILDELYDNDIECWIAGGAVRDFFMGKTKVKDYDLFFPNEDEYNKAYSWLTLENDGVIMWDSDNGTKVVYEGHTFDLVKKFWATPTDTINAFDFTVSMLAVDGEKVYHGESTFIDLAKRQLMFNTITYPGSSMKRAFRYYQKGFQMCGGEQTKLYESIRNAQVNINESTYTDNASVPELDMKDIVDDALQIFPILALSRQQRRDQQRKNTRATDWETSGGGFAGID